jgi:hypothetical protein
MKKLLFIVPFIAAFFFITGSTGCGVYGFNDVGTIPDSVKTVRINYIENRAPYVNPQLSPSLTESLKQKITRQTRLTNTNSDNAHFDIRGEIRDYSVTTTGVTATNGRQQSSLNRLTVTVHIIRTNQLNNQIEEFDITRNFDYSATQTLQNAERALQDEMIRNITDEIFNRLFSNW